MPRRSPSLGLTLVLIGSLLMWAAPQPLKAGDLLSKCPEDSWVVIQAADLAGLLEEVQELSEELEGPAPPPLLEMMKQRLGVEEGLNEAGSFGVVLLDISEYGPMPDPMVIFLPVTDGPAVIQALGGDPTEENPKIFEVVFVDEDGYAAVLEDHLLISPAPESLEYVLTCEKKLELPAPARQRARDADLFVYASLGRMADLAKNTLQAFAPMMMMMAGEQATQVQAVLEAITTLLEQMDFACVDVNLDAEGAKLGVSVGFEPEGSIAESLAEVKRPTKSLLSGLPAGDLLVAYACASTERVLKLYAANIDAWLNVPPFSETMDEEALQELIDVIKSSCESSAGQGAAAFYLLDGEQGLLGMAAVGKVEDADKLMEAAEAICKPLDALLQAAAEEVAEEEEEGEEEEEEKETEERPGWCTYQPAAFTCEGVKVNVWEMDLANFITVVEDEEEGEMVAVLLEGLLGSKTLRVYLARLDEHRIVKVMGGGKAFLTKCIKAAKADAAVLAEAPAVKAAEKMLTSGRVGELYLAPDRIAEAIAKAAELLDEEFETPDAPPANACAALGVTVKERVCNVEICMPKGLIKWVVQATTAGEEEIEGEEEMELEVEQEE